MRKQDSVSPNAELRRVDDTGHATSRRANRVFLGFILIALIMLVVEHRAHVLGWLPWLFLLACPLMHLFMHGGHGGHGHGRTQGDDK